MVPGSVQQGTCFRVAHFSRVCMHVLLEVDSGILKQSKVLFRCLFFSTAVVSYWQGLHFLSSMLLMGPFTHASPVPSVQTVVQGCQTYRTAHCRLQSDSWDELAKFPKTTLKISTFELDLVLGPYTAQ